MLDCGIHPGFSGMASLPYLDQVALEEVDVMLVTHFHLDHCAAMPFVTAKTSFRVRTAPRNPSSSAAHYLTFRYLCRVSYYYVLRE